MFFASSAGVYVRNLPEFVDNYGHFRQVVFLGYLVPKSIACTDFATRTLIFLGRFEAFASGDVRTFLCRPHWSAT